MKNLILLIACTMCWTLNAQQDAMFTKYMFNSISAPKKPLAGMSTDQFLQLKQIEQQIKQARPVGVSVRNAADVGLRMSLFLKKKRIEKKNFKFQRRMEKGQIIAAKGRLQMPLTLKRGTMKKTEQTVAFVNEKGTLLASAPVINGQYKVEGLSLQTGDSGDVYAIVLDYPKDKLGGWVYVLLTAIYFEPLEPIDNPDPGGMIIP